MTFETLIVVIALFIVIGIAAAIATSWLSKVRHEFTVPDGYAGLLYPTASSSRRRSSPDATSAGAASSR